MTQDPAATSGVPNDAGGEASDPPQGLAQGVRTRRRHTLTALVDPPYWQQRWFQLLLGILLVGLVLQLILPPVASLIYATRTVLAPVLIGLALAYVFNPLITWLEERHQISRPLSATGLICVLLLGTLGLLIWLLPQLIGQLLKLIRSLPAYFEAVLNWSGVSSEEVKAQATQKARELDFASLDYAQVFGGLLGVLDMGASAVAGVLGWAGTTALIIAVASICFFFFTWKLGPMQVWAADFIPVSKRKKTFKLLSKMDASVSAYIRGRLIQAAILSLILSIGWLVCGVPYWLLLGLAGGVLGLLPYLAVVTWPLAVGLALLDAVTVGDSVNWWMVLLWPSLVYFVAQFVDGWVVEPIVQGTATDLDPLTVLLVVLAGGTIAGLVGLILAVPVAACIKILLSDVVLPKMRTVAASN